MVITPFITIIYYNKGQPRTFFPLGDSPKKDPNHQYDPVLNWQLNSAIIPIHGKSYITKLVGGFNPSEKYASN